MLLGRLSRRPRSRRTNLVQRLSGPYRARAEGFELHVDGVGVTQVVGSLEGAEEMVRDLLESLSRPDARTANVMVWRTHERDS